MGNLLSNAPIGLSAMAVGTVLTGFLSNIDFDAKLESFLGIDTLGEKEEDEGEFYASLVVMVVTGVWTYLLCMYVNSSGEEKSPKKSGAVSYYDKDPGKEL